MIEGLFYLAELVLCCLFFIYAIIIYIFVSLAMFNRKSVSVTIVKFVNLIYTVRYIFKIIRTYTN